ncbi:MAG TPA: phenylalanine--tRNA ligase subunit beta [Candidatus Rubrimentiphilum sp.]|nr:phenylalanine--tRNA ligase subunit beta [Candidatus Rubrimentiphilum sp.]
MRVPLGWLRDYVDLPADPGAVAEMLALIGFPVAAIETRPVITGVIAGRIAELGKHPNADRLQVGRIDVGDGAPLTIATAATNVSPGQTIAVATIGACLPKLTIERRKMRGLESEGMMISAGELALPEEWFEDGIMQFEESLQPGTDVVEYFRLSEAVLDVEITSNRVDAMSLIGLARELAAYQKVPLRTPDPSNPGGGAGGPKAEITIESPDCRRFVSQIFTGVRSGPSPAWMRIRLALAGQRPINRLVDISNYVMLETAQPLHFYDAAKIAGHHLIVRDARQGERFVALDGSEHELTPHALVIASETSAECLAGLMGARSSEVTDATTELILESANFSGPRIRRTAGQLGFRTEASSRHEKSLAPALTTVGAARAAHLLAQAGATPHEPAAFGQPLTAAAPIDFKISDVKRLLGYELQPQEITEYLDGLGFKAEPQPDGMLRVVAPAWRTDVTCSADVIEEIARMAGYGRISPEIPAVRAHDIASGDYRRERKAAATLAALGYREIVTYSLHGANVYEKIRRAGLEPPARPVEVQNPLSEEQRYLRHSLGPAMVTHLARANGPARAFEIGHVFYSEDRQPLETAMAFFAFSAEPQDEPEWRDSNFLRAKGDCETFLREMTGESRFETAADEREGFHPGKTGVVLMGGREIAVVGQVDPRLLRSFGARLPIYACRMILAALPPYDVPQFKPPSKFPSTYRDLALVCDAGLPSQQVENALRSAAGAWCTAVSAFDEYRGSQVPAGKKSIAIRVTLQKPDATITDAEADAVIEKSVAELRAQFGVTLRA